MRPYIHNDFKFIKKITQIIRHNSFIVGFILFFCTGTPYVCAHEKFGVADPSDFPIYEQNESVFVNDTKVAWADYAALRRDHLGLRKLTNKQINQWIIDNFSYLSKAQLALTNIRISNVPADHSKTKINYRPLNYGRAEVSKTDNQGDGFIDIKGAGNADNFELSKQVNQYNNALGKSDQQSIINTLRISDHSDGMMSFGEAIAEVTRQKAAQKLFDLHNAINKTNLQTVESYFIISLPVNILKDNGEIPAALYGRQSNIGRDDMYFNVPKEIYIDKGNRQRTITQAAIDFGGVLIEDEALQNNFEMFHLKDENDPQLSKPWARGHDKAVAFKAGDESAVFKHVEEMLAPIEKEWSQLEVAKFLNKFSQPGDDIKSYRILGIMNILDNFQEIPDGARSKKQLEITIQENLIKYAKGPKGSMKNIEKILLDSNHSSTLKTFVLKTLQQKVYNKFLALIEKMLDSGNPILEKSVVLFLMENQDEQLFKKMKNKIIKIMTPKFIEEMLTILDSQEKTDNLPHDDRFSRGEINKKMSSFDSFLFKCTDRSMKEFGNYANLVELAIDGELKREKMLELSKQPNFSLKMFVNDYRVFLKDHIENSLFKNSPVIKKNYNLLTKKEYKGWKQISIDDQIEIFKESKTSNLLWDANMLDKYYTYDKKVIDTIIEIITTSPTKTTFKYLDILHDTFAKFDADELKMLSSVLLKDVTEQNRPLHDKVLLQIRNVLRISKNDNQFTPELLDGIYKWWKKNPTPSPPHNLEVLLEILEKYSPIEDVISLLKQEINNIPPTNSLKALKKAIEIENPIFAKTIGEAIFQKTIKNASDQGRSLELEIRRLLPDLMPALRKIYPKQMHEMFILERNIPPRLVRKLKTVAIQKLISNNTLNLEQLINLANTELVHAYQSDISEALKCILHN